MSHVHDLVGNWLVADLKNDCRHVNSLLGIITLTNGTDLAVSRVMIGVIDDSIDKKKEDLGGLLKTIYANVASVCLHLSFVLFAEIAADEAY